MKRLLLICILFLHVTLQPAALAQSEQAGEKNPWAAAGASLLVPGSGQMYVKERVWPEIWISAGVIGSLIGLFVIDYFRRDSVSIRNIDGQNTQLADAYLEAFMLIFQIGVPSLWLWNAGDAYRQAELHNEKVTGDLNSPANAYIIEENLVSVTLWQF